MLQTKSFHASSLVVYWAFQQWLLGCLVTGGLSQIPGANVAATGCRSFTVPSSPRTWLLSLLLRLDTNKRDRCQLSERLLLRCCPLESVRGSLLGDDASDSFALLQESRYFLGRVSSHFSMVMTATCHTNCLTSIFCRHALHGICPSVHRNKVAGRRRTRRARTRAPMASMCSDSFSVSLCQLLHLAIADKIQRWTAANPSARSHNHARVLYKYLFSVSSAEAHPVVVQ